jgi:hypothetical protein
MRDNKFTGFTEEYCNPHNKWGEGCNLQTTSHDPIPKSMNGIMLLHSECKKDK